MYAPSFFSLRTQGKKFFSPLFSFDVFSDGKFFPSKHGFVFPHYFFYIWKILSSIKWIYFTNIFFLHMDLSFLFQMDLLYTLYIYYIYYIYNMILKKGYIQALIFLRSSEGAYLGQFGFDECLSCLFKQLKHSSKPNSPRYAPSELFKFFLPFF